MTRLNQARLLAVITVTIGLAQALPEDRELPISGKADRSWTNTISGENELTGNVVIRQGELSIQADKVVIHRDDDSGEIVYMLANGKPVVFTDLPAVDGEKIIVEGQHIEYFPNQDRIITEGNARLFQAENEARSARIEYNTKTGVMQIESKRSLDGGNTSEQAEFIIQPGVAE